MLLLLQSFNKHCSKFYNHHHSRHGNRASFSVSCLQAFDAEVSSCLNQLLLSSSDSTTLSFHWLLQLLQALPVLHRAFAKLVVDLDCPVAKWGADLVDGYLNYSLNLLDLLNSVSFSLSQLGNSRLSLAYALSLVRSSPLMAVARLNPIVMKRNFMGLENRGIVVDRKKGYSGEEWAIERALATMMGIGYWVCGVVISGCEGDSTAYLEMRRLAAGVVVPAFKELDSVVSKMGSVPEEVKEVNCAAKEVVGSGGGDGEAAEEMRRRLERLEKAVERLVKEVDGRFSEVLDGRSRLLDAFRQPKH
ncbi:protein BPS1, chloroplastic-like [Cucurbita pepo subsp. pepo]|uniref:protein BPS1, chloroplastic-like n=1 Tax=Cucurbita pepo subsp. pepo TaxID=3664 RepID=UPI000C9D7919|nr:protein BPS1, chloroplastic-like [Cucurbita pepo subsp. pepo]